MTNNKYVMSSRHKSSSRLLTTGQATSTTCHRMITVTVDLAEDISDVMDEMSIDLADDVSALARPSAQCPHLPPGHPRPPEEPDLREAGHPAGEAADHLPGVPSPLELPPPRAPSSSTSSPGSG